MTNKWIIIIIGVVLLVVVFTLIAKAGTKNEIIPGGLGTDNGSTSTQSKFPLKLGSRGQEVENWQRYLNSNISIIFVVGRLIVDGNFGTKTQSETMKQIGSNQVSRTEYGIRVLNEVQLA